MFVARIAAVPWIAILLASIVCECHADDNERLWLANLRTRRQIEANGPSNISAALLATIDSGGELKGCDSIGRPIILASSNGIALLKKSVAVDSISEQVPSDWNSVEELTLSYSPSSKPTAGELEGIGLRIVEDYEKGPFLIVEPFNKRIDAALATKLKNNKKIIYADPSFTIRAAQQSPPKSENGEKKPDSSSAAPPTNDPLWDKLWGMRSIGIVEAWKKVTSSSVVVAVIDTVKSTTRTRTWTEICGSDPKGKHGIDYVDVDDDPMDEKQSRNTLCGNCWCDRKQQYWRRRRELAGEDHGCQMVG